MFRQTKLFETHIGCICVVDYRVKFGLCFTVTALVFLKLNSLDSVFQRWLWPLIVVYVIIWTITFRTLLFDCCFDTKLVSIKHLFPAHHQLTAHRITTNTSSLPIKPGVHVWPNSGLFDLIMWPKCANPQHLHWKTQPNSILEFPMQMQAF